MKKFNALFFAMTLLVVVAFASTAGAATFLGIGSDNKLKLISIDKGAGVSIVSNDVGNPSSSTQQATDFYGSDKAETPSIFLGGLGWRLFPYGDNKVAAVSNDNVVLIKVEDGAVKNELGDAKYASSGNVSGTLTSSLGVKAVTTFGDAPLFIGTNSLAAIEDGKITSIDVSVDIAFVYNSKLYVVGAVSADNEDESAITGFGRVASVDGKGGSIASGEGIRELVNVKFRDRDIYGKDAKDKMGYADSAELLSSDSRVLPSLVLGDILFVASPYNETDKKDGLKYAALEASLIKNFELKDVDEKANGSYVAMTQKGDDTIIAVESEDSKEFYLVSLKVSDKIETTGGVKTRTVNIVKSRPEDSIESDISKYNNDASIDVFVNGDVVVVVNQGKAFAAYDAETLKFIGSQDYFRSIAPISLASDNSNNETDDSTVVKEADLNDTQKANLKDVIGDASLVEAKEESASASTLTTAASDKIKEAFDPQSADATVTARKIYTPSEAGYLLVELDPSINASTAKAYFVELAPSSGSTASLSAVNDPIGADLLDDTCSKATSGQAAFAGSDELTAGTSYLLAVATPAASPTTPENPTDGNDDGTGSGSGGGCDVGFGLWSIAALVAVATFSKRR